MSNNEIVSIAMDESLAKKLTNHVAGLGMTKNQYLRNLIMQDLMPRPGERTISLEEALLKENAGLRLNLYKYKRKYKALNHILRGGLYDKIYECGSLIVSFTRRRNRANTDEEKKISEALIRHVQQEKTELNKIYTMCIEATKD